MHRVGKTEGAPKKTYSEPEENVIKEAITKSGRKVRRPAHLDPEEQTPSALGSDVSKSLSRKTKNTLEAFDSPVKRTPRKRASAMPENYGSAGKASRNIVGPTRKTIASLVGTPKVNKEKETEKTHLRDTVDESGVSKSGRKIKIPAKLVDFESEIVSSPRKTAKIAEGETKNDSQPVKTPGRLIKSAKKRKTDDDTAQQPEDELVKECTDDAKSTAAKVVADALAEATEIGKEEVFSRLILKKADKTGIPIAMVVAPSLVKDVRQTETNDEGETKRDSEITVKTPGRLIKLAKKQTTDDDAAQQPEGELVKERTGRAKSTVAKKVEHSTSSIATVHADAQAEEIEIGKGEDFPKVILGRTDKTEKPNASVVSTSSLKVARKTETNDEGETKRNSEVTVKTPGRSIKLAKKQTTHDDTAQQPKAELVKERTGSTTSTAAKDVKYSTSSKATVTADAHAEETELGKQEVFSKLILKNVDKTEKLNISVVATSLVKDVRQTETNDGEETKRDSHVTVKTPGRPIKLTNRQTTVNDTAQQPEAEVVTQRTGREKSTAAKEVEYSTSMKATVIGDARAQETEICKHEEFPKLLLKKADKTEKPNASLMVVATSPVKVALPVGETEGHVTRSGRKIKVKKMFGFDDGTPKVRTDTKCNEEQNTSPALKKRGKTFESKLEEASSPLKTAVEMIDAENNDVVDKAPSAWDCFITKRGINDHQSYKNEKNTQTAQGQMPDGLLSSVVKQAPLARGSSVIKSDTGSLPTGNANHKTFQNDQTQLKLVGSVETVAPESRGSSRSGRKIKPKKFFDDIDPNLSLGQASPSKATKDKKKSTIALVVSTPVKGQTRGNYFETQPRPRTEEELSDVYPAADSTIELKKGIDTNEAVDVSAGSKRGLSEPKDNEMPEVTKSNDTSSGAKIEEMHTTCTNTSHSGNKNTTSHDVDVLGEKLGEAAQEVNDVAEGPTELEKKKRESFPTNAVNVGGEDELPQLIPLNANSGPDVQDLFTESCIDELRVDDADLLEGSFGEIEYLDAEVPNIVEHIKKPSSRTSSRNASEEKDDDVIGAVPVVPTVTIVPATPMTGQRKFNLNATFSPVKPNKPTSSVVVIDLSADTPQVGHKHNRLSVEATAPRTPDSKATGRNVENKFSPDKPPEIIDITDSPAAMAFCQQIDVANSGTVVGGRGSATSTPLVSKEIPGLALAEQKKPMQRVQLVQLHGGRKRSLSASAADTTIKRNVTFHSPANCTVLVEAIDERLAMKNLQQKEGNASTSSSQRSGSRKRSMSEHKAGPDNVKPSKICKKVPNFRNIHENYFDRMESISDFMKRKEQRAKNILTSASPALKLLSRTGTTVAAADDGCGASSSVQKKSSAQKPFIFKSAGGGLPMSTATLFSTTTATNRKPTNIARPVLKAASRAAAVATKKKTNTSNVESRMGSRLQQYQTAFKPKQNTNDVTTTTTNTAQTLPAGATTSTGPVGKLRAKQSNILKGVRTNRRFELQMKHRDNLQPH